MAEIKDKKAKGLRIIVFDIETLPNPFQALIHWLVLSRYPGVTLRAPLNSILCFGWKELGAKSTHVICAWDFPTWEKDVNDDEAICRAAHKVLCTADVIITHNGKRFDEKLMRTRLVKYGLRFPKITHVDTCSESKKNYYLVNNKLNTVGEFFVGEKKMEHEGWQLWVDCWYRMKKAMAKMKAYCRQDVNLLEKVYMKMRPDITGTPNSNLFHEENMRCPACASLAIQRRGPYYRKNRRAGSRMSCMSPECGKWFIFDGDKHAFPRET